MMTKKERKLFKAIQTNDVDLFKKAIYDGANIHVTNDFDGSTPLLEAIDTGNLTIFKKLVELGANINQPSSLPINQYSKGFFDGITPLMYAARTNQLEIIDYLLSFKSIDLHANAIKPECGSAIFFCVCEKNYETFSKLMAAGLNINHVYPCESSILILDDAQELLKHWESEQELKCLEQNIETSRCEQHTCFF